jgi:probable rRNA maturation factor
MTDPIHVSIDLTSDQRIDDLPNPIEASSQKIIAATLQQVGLAGWFEASIVLTDDRRMRRINRQHRGIDATTDVLSFPLNEAPLLDLPPEVAWADRAYGDDTHAASTMPSLSNTSQIVTRFTSYQPIYGNEDIPVALGDIMISIPTIMQQAISSGVTMAWEYAFLLAHGTLHLVGYDDYHEIGYRTMVAAQLAALDACGFVPQISPLHMDEDRL